ncbi:unnamed protein product [Rotaria sordida]|uniref:Uncharacterized protein n=1 Tax=Rotaria sordida TaxID=392033 RepID=A0A815MQT0_9BILA|nr:unnamed protein product [Rotaria sordida]CAF1486857.1 unnamed protein product [Rotaria sordida]CAF3851321.1 unnamed protein product [Rotaria sordida]CAF3924509.1 unnamed protein product [Rotaria sordida]
MNQNRSRSRSNQRRTSLSNQQRRSRSNPQRGSQIRQQQQRQRGPRQLKLNDFMPPQLRDPSPDTPNLPSDLNLAANIPSDALPQREIFASANNNTTQPFKVNQNDQNQQQLQQNQRQQQQATTTAAFRRRQRRNRQQQYRQNKVVNNNRFAVSADNNNDDPIEIDLTDNEEEVIQINTNKKNKEKNKEKDKKTQRYLEPNRMLKWFEENCTKNSKNPLSSRGNQVYLLATAPIYDEWI